MWMSVIHLENKQKLILNNNLILMFISFHNITPKVQLTSEATHPV